MMATKLLCEITDAPLTANQRLTLLKRYALPKLHYTGQLGIVSKADLEKVDLLIRNSVRKWLGLPHDTTNGYLHARIRDGGIGVEPLYPLAILRRSRRFVSCSARRCEMMEAVRISAAYKAIEGKSLSGMSLGGRMINSSHDVYDLWKTRLYSTLDGSGLKVSSQSTSSHIWVTSPKGMYPWMYQKALQLRGHTLKTKARESRGGRGNINLQSKGGCRRVESLTHILQECKVIQRLRIARHNRVVSKLEGSLRRAGSSVLHESYTPCGDSYVKPDLLACRMGAIFVLDVIICSDSRLRASWNAKIQKDRA
ncbi:unnamed protein product [Schistosoma rodhaini]|uniref:Reverse transcriptase domain-containing protein n=1 Tax=Schistosoma rodhaini TaxID=6188 RepID=A0AA85FF16_9TREM|nr:unnamed protein product [Schistosoma rodhaini]